jgi:phosphoglycolate phosphatase-like HAD superfamily hydrolase
VIKLVVFDWNGTLLADVGIVLKVCNATEIPILGIQPISIEQLRNAYEVPHIKGYARLGVSPELFNAKAIEMSTAFQAMYEPLAAKAPTRRGVRHTLDALRRHGVKMIILSNHTVKGIRQQLNRLQISSYFSDILANDDAHTAHHTGKQHRIEGYLHKHHIKPDEVVIVGDAPEEIEIARDLGLCSISLSGGMCSRERLVAAKPDHLISSVKQIVSIVEGIT